MRHMFALLVACLITLPTLAAPPTVSRETTYYLGPLDDEGYVDYIAALNAAFGDAEAKPEDNVFVGILKQIDTSTWDVVHVKSLYATLGVEPPENQRSGYLFFDEYAQREGLPQAPPFDWENAPPEAEPPPPPSGTIEAMLDRALEGPWTAAELPHVAAWLDEIGEPLDALANAIDRPSYYAPVIRPDEQATLVEILLPHLGVHRQIARTLQIRVHRDLQAGNLDAAVEDILSLERLARWQTYEAQAISHLVAMSINALAHYAQHELLAHPELRMTHLNRLRRGRADLPAQIETIDSVLGGERAYFLDFLGFTSRPDVEPVRAREAMEYVTSSMGKHVNGQGKPLASCLVQLIRDPQFDIDRALRRSNIYWKLFEEVPEVGPQRHTWIEAASDHGEALAAKRIELIDLILAWSEIEALRPADADKATDTIVDLLTNLTTINSALFRIEQQNLILDDLKEVTIALAIFRLREGGYPESLDALKPRYLRNIPLDSASGLPLIYRRDGSGYLLYSIGMDREDDGGENDFGEGDISVRLEH